MIWSTASAQNFSIIAMKLDVSMRQTRAFTLNWTITFDVNQRREKERYSACFFNSYSMPQINRAGDAGLCCVRGH